MKIIVCFFMVLVSNLIWSQNSKTYQVRTIAFYNVENLFDTKNDTLIFDDNRTPEGKDNWTQNRYNIKVAHIAKVLSEIGADITKTAPDIIGICEVENYQVIEDVINHDILIPFDYGIVHFDSPDERGIDVALLYKKAVFTPTNFNSHRLLLYDAEGYRNYTRDQLVVEGLLDDELLHLIVNHWPSRSGGEMRSRPYRLEAAKLNSRIIDSIQKIKIDAKIISMGDFNDGPKDDSFKKVLRTSINKKDTMLRLYNPMEKLHKMGVGSLAYRDQWNLFDQLILSPSLLNTSTNYYFWKASVFNPEYLTTKNGKYKGYPFRTYAGGSYASDHFLFISI